MVTQSPSARPGWFRIVAVVLLLWNLLGVAAFFMQYSMTPEALAALPEGQRVLFESMPTWVWVVYGVAVFAGTLGALMLLMTRRVSLPLFWVSLLAVLAQFAYAFFPGGALDVLGAVAALPLPLVVIAIAIVQVWLARKASARGWLR